MMPRLIFHLFLRELLKNYWDNANFTSLIDDFVISYRDKGVYSTAVQFHRYIIRYIIKDFKRPQILHFHQKYLKKRINIWKSNVEEFCTE